MSCHNLAKEGTNKVVRLAHESWRIVKVEAVVRREVCSPSRRNSLRWQAISQCNAQDELCGCAPAWSDTVFPMTP